MSVLGGTELLNYYWVLQIIILLLIYLLWDV